MRRTLVIAATLAATVAQAQVLSGTVVDSVTKRPVVGAVVTFVDSADATVVRALTNESGEYRVTRTPAMRRLRLIRMGYTPRDVRLADVSGWETRLDLTMSPLATLLAPVTARASAACAARRDHSQALALYELARSGLLATIVSRDVNAGTIKNLVFDRSSEGENERIQRQSVRIQSATAANSFAAVRNAAGFVEKGFLINGVNGAQFLGPDAEVLLDPDFVAGYCFRVDVNRDRPRQLGLGFFAATRRPVDRVDIDGTLWVDTASRVVKSIEFRYVGMQQQRNVRPGGRISFQEMPNGTVMIDQWSFRVVNSHRSSSSTGVGNFGDTRLWYDMKEAGGELAHARFPNGQEWEAWLGIIHVHVLREDGKPASGSTLLLKDTDYSAAVDSTGWAEFIHVLPGPYSIEIVDSALAAKGVVIGTETRFTAERGKVTMAKVAAPPRDEFLKRACNTNKNDFWVTVQVVGQNGKGVANAAWTLGEDLENPQEHVIARGITRTDGRLGFCHERTHAGALQLRVITEDEPGRARVMPVAHIMDKEVKLELPPA
jgi:hypothetical protein